MERGLMFKLQARAPTRPVIVAAAVAVDVAEGAAAAKGTGNEYFAAIHSPAGSDFVADGRCPSGRRCRVSAITGLGTAASRLSDHSGRDVLSGSESGSDVVVSHGSPGAAVRTSTRLETDDILELVWMFCHHTSVFTGSEH